MFNSIRYNVTEGFKSIWRNRTMAIASVASVAASLFVLGLVLSLVLNINNLALMTQKQFDNIQIFMVEEAKTEDIGLLKSKIEELDHVSRVDFESKEIALEKLRERWGEDAYLLDGLENPLQNSLVIELTNLRYADEIVNQIQENPLIDSISYYKDVVDKLLMISRVISTAGMSVILLLFVISMFVISNTIKIVLYARKREINIMKYIGATNWFIRWPFIIEGIILGLLGATISLGFIFTLYNFVYEKLGSGTYTLIRNSILPIETLFSSMSLSFLSMGVGIGILGSLVSLRRHLKV